MHIQSSKDLTLHFLKDIYYAERQILKSLPKLAKAAENAELKQALIQHRDETQGQIERLQKVFESLGKRAQGTTCEAINGLIEECEELIDQTEAGGVRDAGLIACSQAVEHYEIARYGALVAWLKGQGLDEAAAPLQETLDQEKATDARMTNLANSVINQQAEHAA